MEKVLRNKFFYSFLALLFALLLFFNANSNSGTRVTQTAQTYDTTVYDVPIEVNYDESKYYVSGFPDTVTVHLSSLNRIKLAQEASNETRTFKVVADLTTQSAGTVDVILRATNLTSGVEAVIDPATISVTIENKVTKEFSVTPIVDKSIFQDGYELSNVSLDKNEVSVTTGEQTMTQIAEIQAKLNSTRSVNEDYEEEVTLQAVDEKGEVLPVTIDPEKVKAKVTVTAPEKEIPVSFEQTGKLSSGIKSFVFQGNVKTVSATGSASALGELSEITLPVDVTNIRMQQSVKVTLPSDDQVTYDPEVIEVLAIPVFENNTTTSSSTLNTPPASSTTPSSSATSETKSTSETSTSSDTKSSESTESSAE